ncbi:MAG TPA: right-handed parallel beta-helix repeat-containing protein [Deltaproteobacteria bacterium]|nr:right-handed parallel beta-helix repeat-containing protein [Deltaproteobacteria bacterium]
MRSLGLFTFLVLPSLASAQDLALTFTQLLPGNPVDFTVTNLNANETVYILRAVGTGGGACPPQIGGECLGITGPLSVVGAPTADATGTASLQIVLPASAPLGANVSFQAAAVRGLAGADSVLSNAIGATISGPSLCPVYADPNVLPGGDGSVGNPFPSIGYALTFRDPTCDEILLYPGTYNENIDYAGADVSITSLGGPANTTLTSSLGGILVTFSSGETEAASLSGVTLSCGSGGGTDRGVELLGSSATLDDLVITGCDQGVYLSGGGGSITNSTFEANTGGAIYMLQSSDPVITGNTFDGNSGPHSVIYTVLGTPYIVGNTIRNNTAPSSSEIVFLSQATTTFVNNHLEGNDAPSILNVAQDSYSTVAHNTWISNIGTAAEFSNSSSTYFFNNLFYDNQSFAVISAPSGTGGPSFFLNNNIFPANPNGLGAVYSNFNVDPMFVPGTAELDWGSPLIDAGIDPVSYGLDISAIGLDADRDGGPRPLGLGYDIGAYESW